MYRIGDAREPVPTVVDAGLAAAKKRPTQFGRFSDPNRSIFGVRLAELARTFHSGGALERLRTLPQQRCFLAVEQMVREEREEGTPYTSLTPATGRNGDWSK